MSRFIVKDTELTGLKLIERHRIGDNRGSFSRLFCRQELAQAGWSKPIAQINHTHTSKLGALRGMHLQLPPSAEMKLVSCIRGKVWDVAVDVRANSPTFLQWHAEILSAENSRALLIPEGFAHGFQALTPDVELLYCHSEFHSSQDELGLHYADPRLSIPWPLEVSEVSARDSNHSFISVAFLGVIF